MPLILAAVLACGPASLRGQPPGKSKEAAAPRVDEFVPTRDGVQLRLRYYPGPAAKTTGAVILLHDAGEQSIAWEGLARFLQSRSGGRHAVLVPDLRAHGESLRKIMPGAGKEIQLSADRLRRDDLADMVRFDLEAAKKYLLDRHHAEELNIDALAVVGAGMGAIVALHWTAQDWNWPALAGAKQGQDVKAVALLSPEQTYKGLTAQAALTQPDLRHRVSFLLLYGEKDAAASRDARRLFATLERYRPADWTSPEEDKRRKSLFLLGMDTSLGGSQLLTGGQLPTERAIAQFISARVTDLMEEQFPWRPRRLPIDN